MFRSLKVHAFISALIFTNCFALAASKKDVNKFLSDLPGRYTLIQDKALPGTQCPSNIIAEIGERSVKVINLDHPEDPQRTGKFFKNYHRIGQSRQRFGDDMFTYNDSIYRLNKSADSVIYETRNCAGMLIVRCDEWCWESRLQRTAEDQIEISVNEQRNIHDNSGFPHGSCLYKKVTE
jgi:hypothetical protein